jgi:hypothetical protein
MCLAGNKYTLYDIWNTSGQMKLNVRLCLVFIVSIIAEVTGEWRKLCNEELNDLYSLPNIARVVKSRRMRWAGHVARMWEDRGVHRVLVGKPEGKRPLGRPRWRWEDNIKMNLRKLEDVVGTGWSWLRIGTGGRHLWVR